jgi:uncharacterized protein (TIGR03546 family)
MFWLTPVRFLVEALTSESSSRQIAFGFAIGLVVGLVPKGNLLAVALLAVLYCLRVNLAAGLAGAILFSWVGMLADPLTHEIGLWLLQADALEPMWTAIYNLPVAPWTSFNNTVVLGSLAFGLVLFYPVYKVTERLAARYGAGVQQRLAQFRIVRLLWGLDLASNLRGTSGGG